MRYFSSKRFLICEENLSDLNPSLNHWNLVTCCDCLEILFSRNMFPRDGDSGTIKSAIAPGVSKRIFLCTHRKYLCTIVRQDNWALGSLSWNIVDPIVHLLIAFFCNLFWGTTWRQEASVPMSPHERQPASRWPKSTAPCISVQKESW